MLQSQTHFSTSSNSRISTVAPKLSMFDTNIYSRPSFKNFSTSPLFTMHSYTSPWPGGYQHSSASPQFVATGNKVSLLIRGYLFVCAWRVEYGLLGGLHGFVEQIGYLQTQLNEFNKKFWLTFNGYNVSLSLVKAHT